MRNLWALLYECVIIRMERENFHVLSMHGKVMEVKPQSIMNRRENRNAIALDSEQNTIRRKDIVNVVDGPHAGRRGEIKHLHRCFAFLHSGMFIDNGGTFVCKTRHLQLPGSNKTNSLLIILTARTHLEEIEVEEAEDVIIAVLDVIER